MIDFLNLNIITFVSALGFLGLWFIFSNSRKWNAVLGLLFFISLGINLGVNYFFSIGPLKYFYFSKNLLLIGFFGMIFNWVKHNKIALFAAVTGSIFISFPLFNLPIPTKLIPEDVHQMMEEGELIIEIEEQHLGKIQKIIQPYNGKIVKAFHPQKPNESLNRFYIIDLPSDQAYAATKLLQQLKDDSMILYGEYNDEISITPIESNQKIKEDKDYGTNDPLAEKQWAMNNLNLHRLHGLILQNKEKIKKKIVVAVLDTGIDGQHEDLKKIIDPEFQNTKDPVGHGTHCAGIVAAITNNKKGVSSMAFYDDLIEILPIKVLNSFGFGTQAQIINGMIEAVDSGADILSLSLGGLSDDYKQRAYSAAVAYANDQNRIVVVSAGNSSANASDYSPANVDGVICVAATNETNQMANFSNHIEDVQWGIAAPGVNILSTYKNNSYKALNGTSMAAPFVASTAAVIKAFYPDIPSHEFYELIRFTAIPSSGESFSPIIQPAAALELLLDGWESSQ